MNMDNQCIPQVMKIGMILFMELSCTTLLFAANNRFGTIEDTVATTQITQGLAVQTNIQGFDTAVNPTNTIIEHVASNRYQ